MKEVMAITKALADENRARILLFLQEGELCVCRILELLQLAPSTVSKHLNILYRAGLVESRKEGRWIYYRLPGKNGSPRVRGAIRWLLDSLESDANAARDARKVKAVRKMSLETLCCRYKTKE